nr:hypothetical protein [Pedobacter sp. ASV2]
MIASPKVFPDGKRGIGTLKAKPLTKYKNQIAFLTVSFEPYKTAKANPVEALKYE